MSDFTLAVAPHGRDLRHEGDGADVSILGAITVVKTGHIRCKRCGYDCQWSGGMRPAGGRFGSESLGAYLVNAQHDCNPTVQRQTQSSGDGEPRVRRRWSIFGRPPTKGSSRGAAARP